ncbi:hypothetical protein [Flavobacterium gelatinilyticum]|uniref:hypothetical protein n=1 Tax=Flavobacterium gelatinilyticum TaxID=3003260 RepID=UPI0024808346|nr:hypothetical protein [Flavobacterium gelatinilyticum]
MNEEVFPGPIQIPLSTAKEWEKKYDETDISTIETARGAEKVKAFLIPRETLESVLKLDTEAVRAYLGINDEGEKTLIFVGAELDKETGKYVDVYGQASQGMSAKAADYVVYDGARPSPPY